MGKYVVTLGRQFGSMGRSIAQLLSEQLHIEYYDRDIVDQAARELGIPVDSVDTAEGRLGTTNFLKRAFPLGRDLALQDQVFQAESRIISQLADKSSCIIVGRCADFILEDEKNRISIFVYAPFESRLKNCVTRLGMEPAEAKKIIREVDAARKAYHKKYTGYHPGSLEHYDLLVNSATLGVEKTADFLADYIRALFEPTGTEE